MTMLRYNQRLPAIHDSGDGPWSLDRSSLTTNRLRSFQKIHVPRKIARAWRVEAVVNIVLLAVMVLGKVVDRVAYVIRRLNEAQDMRIWAVLIGNQPEHMISPCHLHKCKDA